MCGPLQRYSLQSLFNDHPPGFYGAGRGAQMDTHGNMFPHVQSPTKHMAVLFINYIILYNLYLMITPQASAAQGVAHRWTGEVATMPSLVRALSYRALSYHAKSRRCQVWCVCAHVTLHQELGSTIPCLTLHHVNLSTCIYCICTLPFSLGQAQPHYLHSLTICTITVPYIWPGVPVIQVLSAMQRAWTRLGLI